MLSRYGPSRKSHHPEYPFSQLVTGKSGMEKWLYQYRDAPITLPKKKDYYPRASFRDWHTREVFKRYEV